MDSIHIPITDSPSNKQLTSSQILCQKYLKGEILPISQPKSMDSTYSVYWAFFHRLKEKFRKQSPAQILCNKLLNGDVLPIDQPKTMDPVFSIYWVLFHQLRNKLKAGNHNANPE